MSRTLKEWIGKTDDTAIPPRVMLRVFEKYGGRCAKCTRKIGKGFEPWDCDHVVAIINRGQNRESNLQPLCDSPCHTRKTKTDIAEKSATYKSRLKAVGIKPKRKGRPMPGSRASGFKAKIGGGWERR
jgi:5-methylcytosine-specific restriction protein A